MTPAVLDDRAIEKLAEAVAVRIAARLLPFFLGVLDGAGIDDPEARATLLGIVAPPAPAAKA
jgi:hypothetical protein